MMKSLLVLKSSPEYQKVTDAEFEQKVLEEGLPAVVVFAAEWMGGAMIIHAIIERLSQLYEGVCFFHMDLGESKLAREFVVDHTITILFFNDGEMVDHQIGLTSKAGLKKKIETSFSIDN